MKKIEAAAQFLKGNLRYFQCPVCQQAMERMEGSSISCQRGHQFDLSRKGTLHLLQKGGQNEYGREMLSSRKRLADTGFFYPLLDEVFRYIEHPDEAGTLDVGCGEGSQLHYLAQKGLGGVRIGFDISKDAIQLAATHFFDDAFWCVADLAHSPFAAGQFTTILNIFSPSHYQEFMRLLAVKGQVLKVVPAPDYLVELRQALYADRPGKQEYGNEAVIERFAEFFPDYEKVPIRYQVQLTPNTWQWLVEMTPLAWGAAPAARQKVWDNPLPEVTVAVDLLVGRKS